MTDLPPGAGCNVRVAFAPTRRDELLSATLTVNSANVGAASLALVGAGLAPGQIGVPERLDFGSVVLGQSSRATLSIQNRGDDALVVPVPNVQGADADSFIVAENRCGEVLTGSSSCEIGLEFRPLRPDAHLAEFALEGAQGLTTRVTLEGVGLRPGALALALDDGGIAPATTLNEFDFGGVPVAATASLQRFVVTNTGMVPSGAVGIEVANVSSGAFELDAAAAEDDCRHLETSLDPGRSCKLRIRFMPIGPGRAEGSLAVLSDLAGSAGVQLRGTGIGAARLVLASASVVQYGQLITSAVSSATVTLRNDGNEALPPVTVEIVPSAPGQLAEFFVASNGCENPVAPQATCAILVELRPTAAGTHSASLSLQAGAAGSVSVGLSGRAVLPGSLAVQPRTGQFVTRVNTASEIQTFTVTNAGADSGPVRFNSTNADFRVQEPRSGSTDCVFNQTRLAAEGGSASCTLRVVFQRALRGAGVGGLEIASPNAGSTRVDLSGTAQAPPALSGAQSNDFGTLVVGASGRFGWSVRNDGDIATGALQLANSNTTDYRTENGCSLGLASQASCTVNVFFEPKSQNPAGAPLSATITLQGQGVSLALRATGSGRQLQQPGQACTAADQCARAGDVCSFNNNAPGDGAICCNEACTNSCETCNTAGTCAAIGDGQSCGSNLVCRGELCLKQNGQPCRGSGECAQNVCDGNRGICCAQSCTGQTRCNAAGNGCEPIPQGNGSTCTSNAQCGSNFCDGRIGRCCAACPDGSRCTGNGLGCEPIPQGNGSSCMSNAQCTSNFCDTRISRCCSACPAGSRCTANGLGCELIPRGPGEACGGAGECASGFCVDSVCCNAACNNVCEACNRAATRGTCSFQPGPCDGNPDQVCSARGVCDLEVCVLASSSVGECRLAP